MGKPPSVIVIARHGARLDSADKEWHLTSPTPYDPPLSYGGWLQSYALGVRIDSLLRSPLNPESSTSHSLSHAPGDVGQAPTPTPTPIRKRKIIIHTSPYLRCLQTAIAASAGLSQRRHDTDGGHGNDPCVLRVDACLGEWLTPDYFEEIIPPPSSDRMVMAAKAELLRRGEDLPSNFDPSNRSAAAGYFPGGWGSLSNFVLPDVTKTAPLSVQSNRHRAASYDAADIVSYPRTKGVLAKIDTNVQHASHSGYVPPTPSYAVSSSDPIPLGYVAHARDACTRVDYQWDSMRGPQDWGHGGNYGEEWSSMHSRFHRILQNMVNWYRDHDHHPQPARNGESQQSGENGESRADEDEDEDEASDIVLVIVTHGAGCNALIGALTGEPALVDVGTASLTMATLRAVDNSPSLDLPQEYSLRLVASTDHLRPGSDPSDLSALSSPKPRAFSPTLPSRHRFASRASPSQSPFIIGPSPTTGSAARESSNSRPSTSSRASPGLWGQGSAIDDEIMPNFDGPGSPALPANSSVDSPRDGAGPEGVQYRTLPQPGLWGSAPLSHERDGMGRRWTVTERQV